MDYSGNSISHCPWVIFSCYFDVFSLGFLCCFLMEFLSVRCWIPLPDTLCICVPSRVRLFATPWTVAHQAPLSVGFSMQEYWSELPFPSLVIILTQGSNPHSSHVSPALAGRFFTTSVSWETNFDPLHIIFPSHFPFFCLYHYVVGDFDSIS